MTDVFSVDTSVLDIVDGIARNELPDLIKVYDPQEVKNSESRVAFMFREEAAKSGGSPVLAKTGKVSPKIRPLLKNEHIEVIVEIAYDKWMELDNNQRKGLLYHELSRLVIAENPETGELKISLRSPDISYFYNELQLFGDWRPREAEEEGGEIPPAQFCEEVERILGVKSKVTVETGSTEE